MKKSIQFFFTSFRRKPESSVFKVLRTYWTPVFTGVTAEKQFFHSFGDGGGFLARMGLIQNAAFDHVNLLWLFPIVGV
ncbi:MAG: hypothetical protein NTX30_13225 [Deltaproteobacteria bacterium]|nr:hypothetical protein [Deltaproteobacteria bacterium]